MSAAGAAARARKASERPLVPSQRVLKVHLPSELDEALRAVSASYGVSLSHVVRDALELWLSEWEEAKGRAAAHRVMGQWPDQKAGKAGKKKPQAG